MNKKSAFFTRGEKRYIPDSLTKTKIIDVMNDVSLFPTSIGTQENKSVEKGNREKRHFLQSMEKIIRLKPLAKEASSGRTKMRPLLPPPPSSRTTPIIPNTKRGKRMNSRRKRSRREDYKRLGMITKLQQTD